MLNVIQSGKGTPIVFLHGALVSNTMWKDQVEHFSKNFEVITVDLPGHGASSDLSGDYRVEALAEIVCKEVIEQLGSCIVCGHSLGGMVAQQIALQRPEKVVGLILAETSFGTKNNAGEKIQSAFAGLFLSMMSAEMTVKTSGDQYGKINPETKAYILKEMGKYDKAFIKRVMSAALNYAGKELLREIKCKTLILVSSENKQTHRQASVMNAQIENSKLEVIPVSHHLLNLDNPSAFNEAVDLFLRDSILAKSAKASVLDK